MADVENCPIEQIALGATVTVTRALSAQDLQLLAALAGETLDVGADPADPQLGTCLETGPQGTWAAAFVANALSMTYPGPGTIYLGQRLRFITPVRPGDVISLTLTVMARDTQSRQVTLQCRLQNAAGELLISGEADVLAPAVKIRRTRGGLPTVRVTGSEARYRQLMSLVTGLAPVRMAIVHPCDRESLLGAVEAAQAGLIAPVLVGPAARIRAVAREQRLNIDAYPLEDVPHSHAAAERAVAMSASARIEALMKGSLHTDELMAEVLKVGSGLRTARRLSHVFLVDVPAYPRPLFITDAAINITPNLDDKRDIAQNAIDLAHLLGLAQPRVAILAAVETVSEKMRSTLDAAALCKMAERGQISGGVLDGPLAFDNAVSPAAAATKGIHSAVAGRADILVVPDLEAGNMLVKQLQYLADAQVAGIVLGARIPIVLTSRADSAHARTASCALAQLIVRGAKRAPA